MDLKLCSALVFACLIALSGCKPGCASAGGVCHLGGVICYGSTPADDDCNSDRNPGGAFCCVGTACEPGKSPLADGGCGAADGSGCLAKGGTCESSQANCARTMGSMDCAVGGALPGDVQCCGG